MSQVDLVTVAEFQTEINELTSKRMRILKGLELLMTTVTKDNGYTDTVEGVSFEVNNWQSKAQDKTPFVFIIDDNQTRTRNPGSTRNYTWVVKLFSVTRDKNIEEFEDYIADIETALNDNNTLFGQINKVEVERIFTDNQTMLNEGIQLAEHELEILYTRPARNAR